MFSDHNRHKIPYAFTLIAFLLFGNSMIVADERHGLTTAEEHLRTPALTNDFCPVMTDEKIDPNISLEYQEKQVFLCCKMCKRQFLAEPEKYLENLPQFSIVTGKSSQDETPKVGVVASLHDDINEERLEDHQDGGEIDSSNSVEPKSDTGLIEDKVLAASIQANRHDHGTGHGQSNDHHTSPNTIKKVITFGGKFHPVLVHFPIALAIAALLAEIFAFSTKKTFFRSAGRFTIILAAAGALLAAPLGWAAASGSNYPSMESTLEWHRWVGTVGSILLIGCVILSEWTNRRDTRKIRVLYLGVLVATAFLIAFTGHLGATLIYGADHFTF